MSSPNGKVLTIILDGWGVYKPYPGNAVELANKPYYDSLVKNHLYTSLKASGLDVGLPNGQMGSSEINHMIIGAGRVLYQDLVKINESIKDGTFDQTPEFLAAFEHVKKHNSKLHIKGLYSPGGVHSHSDHFFAIAKLIKKSGLSDKAYYHIITDGRDTKPQSGYEYIKEFVEFVEQEQIGNFASIGGRYFAMDRDHNWERTDKYFEMITQGKTPHHFNDILEAIEHNYQNKITDEFIEPTLIVADGQEPALIENNDAVIFINFRNDRPRQIVERFLEKGPKNLYYVTMTHYSPEYDVKVAFPPVSTEKTLPQVISEAGLKQLRITETEKFAHLTFFMNCKREEPFVGEDRVMINSYSDIAQHDERPEMRAPDIANRLIDELKTEKYSAIFVNLCNADMVGHTGNIPAAIKGIEAIDAALAKIVPVARECGYDVIVTADHGNAEQMLDEKTNERLTAHTINPVPFILITNKYHRFVKDDGSQPDVAPTILKLMGIEQPEEMTGESLV